MSNLQVVNNNSNITESNLNPEMEINSTIDISSAISEGSEILEQLQVKIIEYLNDNVDKYKLVPSNGNLTDFVSDIYRYRKGDGILLHRDSDGVETYGKRYGISFQILLRCSVDRSGGV